jgi:hypothetical protein
MMNCCEGLTVRAGNAACSDWQAKIDNVKTTRRFIFMNSHMIISMAACLRARIDAKLFLV